MRRTRLMRFAAPAAVFTALLMTAACGDAEITSDSKKPDSKDDKTPSAAAADTSAGEGNWLLAMQTAGGSDAETATTTYLTFNPSTGQATARKLPGVQAGSASPEQAALLVSADRRWAIPDTEITRSEENSGRLKVYSLDTGNAKVVDIRQRSGEGDLKAIGWAFDPERADTLRIVDTANRIWAVNVAGGKATQEGTLAKGPWVFTNGFNRNTGEPYMESIDSDATNPAGNGPTDASPITRDSGTVLPNGSEGLTKLPASPCRLGAGFTDANGVTWTFCADKPTVSTYYLPKGGTEWVAYGKPSAPVAPTAAAFPLVLPPAT
jgi:hypothetical protein